MTDGNKTLSESHQRMLLVESGLTNTANNCSIETDDLFGPDAYTQTKPKDEDGRDPSADYRFTKGVRDYAKYGDPERGEGRKERKKQTDHNPRTRSYWEGLGYEYFRVDGYQSQGNGMFVKRDLMGIFDACARRKGEPPIWIQICSRSDTSTHLRKMCSNDVAENKKSRLYNLRFILSMEDKVVLHAWDQPNLPASNRWRGEVRYITEVDIAQVLARKRK